MLLTIFNFTVFNLKKKVLMAQILFINLFYDVNAIKYFGARCKRLGKQVVTKFIQYLTFASLNLLD